MAHPKGVENFLTEMRHAIRGKDEVMDYLEKQTQIKIKTIRRRRMTCDVTTDMSYERSSSN